MLPFVCRHLILYLISTTLSIFLNKEGSRRDRSFKKPEESTRKPDVSEVNGYFGVLLYGSLVVLRRLPRLS